MEVLLYDEGRKHNFQIRSARTGTSKCPASSLCITECPNDRIQNDEVWSRKLNIVTLSYDIKQGYSRYLPSFGRDTNDKFPSFILHK